MLKHLFYELLSICKVRQYGHQNSRNLQIPQNMYIAVQLSQILCCEKVISFAAINHKFSACLFILSQPRYSGMALERHGPRSGFPLTEGMYKNTLLAPVRRLCCICIRWSRSTPFVASPAYEWRPVRRSVPEVSSQTRRVRQDNERRCPRDGIRADSLTYSIAFPLWSTDVDFRRSSERSRKGTDFWNVLVSWWGRSDSPCWVGRC